MKKLFAIMLAVLMVLSMAACGGETTPPTTAATNAPTTEPTTEPTTAPTTAPVEQGSKVGNVEGGVYTNAFLGFTADFGADWTFATEEEMGQLLGIAADALADKDRAEMLETSGVVFDLYAVSADGNHNINITMENLNILQSIAVTEKAYAQASVGQLPSALEGMGFTDITADTMEITFAGKTHAGIKIHGKVAGLDFYETLVCVKQGTYMACVTVASYGEDKTTAVLDLFKAI